MEEVGLYDFEDNFDMFGCFLCTGGGGGWPVLARENCVQHR